MRVFILGFFVMALMGCGVIGRFIPDRPTPVKVIRADVEIEGLDGFDSPSDHALAFCPVEER